MRIEEQIALVKSQAATVRGQCEDEIRWGRMTHQAKDEKVRKWNEIVASLERLKRNDEAEAARQTELFT